MHMYLRHSFMYRPIYLWPRTLISICNVILHTHTDTHKYNNTMYFYIHVLQTLTHIYVWFYIDVHQTFISIHVYILVGSIHVSLPQIFRHTKSVFWSVIPRHELTPQAMASILGMNKVVGLTRTGEGMLGMYVGMTRHDRAWHCVLQPTDNKRLLLIVMSCHLVDKTLTCKKHVRLICPRSYRYEL